MAEFQMRYLLDTSAVLAYLLDEPGGDQVGAALNQSSIAAPNAAEIMSALMRRGASEGDATLLLRQLRTPMIALDEALAIQTGVLKARMRHLGISLGDCACLAAATALKAEVLTADRQWAKTGLPVRVHLIR